MARIDEVYPSKWLCAADLNKLPHAATITKANIGKVGSGDEEKTQVVVEFHEFDKPLGLNKTNAGRIGDIYGPDTDDWIGQRIVIFPTKVDFNKQQVDAIRVDKQETQNLLRDALRAAKAAQASRKLPPKPAPVAARPAPMTQEEVDEDGDIPF